MDPEAVARRRAAGQLDLITTAQALKCGLSKDQLKRMVRKGRLLRPFPSVFSTIPDIDCARRAALAACLAAGPAAVASHRSAGWIWDLLEIPPAMPEITVPRDRRRRISGVVVHNTDLQRADRTKRIPIPVTSVARTLVDLSSSLSRDELEGAVDRGIHARRLTAQKLAGYLDDARFRRSSGSGCLRAIVADREKHGSPEEKIERKAIAIIRRFRLPEPERQYWTTVKGRRVRFDLAYPDRPLAIELDGKNHLRPERFQSDHDRDNATELAGWPLVRFTWLDVTERELYVAITLGDALGLRPAKWKRT